MSVPVSWKNTFILLRDKYRDKWLFRINFFFTNQRKSKSMDRKKDCLATGNIYCNRLVTVCNLQVFLVRVRAAIAVKSLDSLWKGKCKMAFFMESNKISLKFRDDRQIWTNIGRFQLIDSCEIKIT